MAELTGMVDLDGYPTGTRIIVRRERPHPGAQRSLFDLGEGMRHEVYLIDTPDGEGSLQQLEVRHRAHARVALLEDLEHPTRASGSSHAHMARGSRQPRPIAISPAQPPPTGTGRRPSPGDSRHPPGLGQ